MNHSELRDLCLSAQADGQSKDEISVILLTNGVTFSKIPQTLKEFGISFGRSKNAKPLPILLADLMGTEDSLTRADLIDRMRDLTSNPKYIVNHYGPIIAYARGEELD